VRVPGSLRLNGEYRLSRVTDLRIPFSGAGFTFGVTSTAAFGLVFDPTRVVAVTTIGGAVITNTVPNYAEISALWERVMIEKVVIEMQTTSTDPINAVNTGTSPVIYYATDETDIFANTLAITQQQAGCKSFRGNSNLPDCVVTCYPKYQRIIYYTALLSSYEPARGFVVSDTEIPHYGLRIAGDFSTTAGSYLKLRLTYHYRCKNVK